MVTIIERMTAKKKKKKKKKKQLLFRNVNNQKS